MKSTVVMRRMAAALGGLTVLLAIPSFASAQANALFPDIYIKRQRPCAGLEDPRYPYIRENYFGYFPTCWRRFPEGWGCPSADAPNWAAALKERPLDIPEDLVRSEEPENTNQVPNPLRDDPFNRRPRGTTPPRDLNLPDVPTDEGSLFRPRTQPETPPAGNDTETDRPTSFTPPRSNPLADDAAPPLAPPAASVPSSLPTTSVMPMPDPGMSQPAPRRGLISQVVGRIRRK